MRLAKVVASAFRYLSASHTRLRLSLRTQLLVLVIAVLLPLLAFAAVLSLRHVQLQRGALERGMKDTAQALSLALDREVGKLQAVLETLAESPYLDSRDFKSFNDLVLRATEHRKDSWVVLFDRSGQQIINTLQPFGASLPNILKEARKSPEQPEEGLPLGSSPTVKSVLETGEPIISDLFRGIVSKRPSLATTVPVIRHGQVAYGLSMVTAPVNFTRLLTEQGLQEKWYASIVDRNGIIISRTNGPEFVGQPVSPRLRKLISQSDRGWSAGEKSDGVEVYSAFARSGFTGWSVLIEAPQASIEAAVNRLIMMIGAGAALLLFMALTMAFIVGRRISAPILALARSAEAIQRGDRVEVEQGASRVKEISEIHSAVIAAGEATREWAAERERGVVEKRLRRLAEVSATLAESIDFEKTLTRLVELMVPDYADWCSIDLLQEGSTVCRRVAVRTSRHDKEHFAEELSRDYAPDLSRPHPIRTAMKTGRSDYTLDLDAGWIDRNARSPRHRFLLEQAELSGVIVVPLRVQGRVAGALSMFASRYSERKYTIADVDFAEEIGRRASVALDNAWLYGEVQRELSERKQTEDALRESEERFRSTFEHAPIGMAHVSLNGRWLRVNDALCRITGYSRSELLEKTFGDVTHPDDLDKSWEHLQSLLKGEVPSYSMEKRYLRKDGSLVWVEITVSLRHDEAGRPLYFIGAIEDITDRTKAQDELRESEERFRGYFELGLVGMAITSPSKGIVEVNDELCKTLGYDRGDLLSKNWTELTHPDDIANDDAQLSRILEGRTDGYSSDKRFVRKDGRIIYARVSLKCLRLADGSVDHLLALIQDITEATQVARRRRVYFAVAQILAQSPSFDEAISRILQTIGEALGWDIGVAWMVEGNLLQRFHVWQGASFGKADFEALTPEQIPIRGLGLAGRVSVNWKPVWVHDIGNDQRFRHPAFAVEAGLHAGFAFPIFRENLLGVVEFYTREIREKDSVMLPMFESIGSQIGQFMERRRAEEALREAHSLLGDRAKQLEGLVEQRTMRLEETVSELEAFSYSISHDMRAPLRAMEGYATALCADYNDRLDDQGKHWLERIMRSSHRLDSLINDVLAYSKLTKQQVDLSLIDLAPLIEDVVSVHPEFQPPKADVFISKPLINVLGHEAYLTQCITNLLSNAVKFVAPGVIPKISIWTELVDGKVRLWFEDNGLGIDPAHHERIFTIFGQVYPEKRFGGSGIGLAIVRKAVQRMNGSVGLESSLNAGSRFWLLLNVENGDDKQFNMLIEDM